MNKKDKIGIHPLFVILHFCAVMSLITICFFLVTIMFKEQVHSKNIFNQLFVDFILIIFGCFGIYMWVLTVPTLRKLEIEFIEMQRRIKK